LRLFPSVVDELNSGCICCTLVGDFQKAVDDLIAKYHPDRLLIERSSTMMPESFIKLPSTPTSPYSFSSRMIFSFATLPVSSFLMQFRLHLLHAGGRLPEGG